MKTYINWLKEKNLSPKTIQIYTEGIRHFGSRPLTLTNLTKFFREKVKGLEASTIITRKTALKSYAKFKELQIKWEKVARLIPRVQKKFFATVNEQELIKLKQAKIEKNKTSHERNNLILDFLFYSGVRVSELVNIKHQDWQDNVLRIHGKGNKVRHILLPEFLIKHFRPGSPGYLFNKSKNKPFTVHSVRHLIDKRVKLAGLKKWVSPHTFRRSLATNLYNRGGRLETIQKQLGHSNIQTTLGYIHNDFNTLYADYSKLWGGTHA